MPKDCRANIHNELDLRFREAGSEPQEPFDSPIPRAVRLLESEEFMQFQVEYF